MRKLLSVLLTLLVALTFVGCGEETAENILGSGEGDTEIASEIKGTWDWLDEDGNVDEEGYMVITSDDIEFGGYSYADGTGIIAKDGQIYSNSWGVDSYYFDYVIDDDIMYLSADYTDEATTPDADDAMVYILQKQ